MNKRRQSKFKEDPQDDIWRDKEQVWTTKDLAECKREEGQKRRVTMRKK